MIAGNIYGVVLNDVDELARMGETLGASPYGSPPEAPVVYMKPRTCVSQGRVLAPSGEPLIAAATIAVLLSRDVTLATSDDALDAIGGSMLALDLMRRSDSYYRPTIAERNADGFLPLGKIGPFRIPETIVTSIDGREVHRWSLSRLVRPVGQLIADLSRYLTLKGGDIMLIGVPGDAPVVVVGQTVRVEADGLATLDVSLQETIA